MKWIAILLIILGLTSIVAAVKMDSSSSFDDGSFLVQIAFAVGGVALLGVGFLILGVLVFMGL